MPLPGYWPAVRLNWLKPLYARMTYATESDLEARFGADELIQRTNRTGGAAIDMEVLGRALADADAEIDSYLATRYTLPLASTPAVLVRLACDITRYQLCGDKVPDSVRQRYEDAVGVLKRMATGSVQLAGMAPVPAVGGSGNAVAVRTARRLFGPEQLASY